MCELLGLSANVPSDIRFSFTGLMQRGGATATHTDGWGISFYEGKGCQHFIDSKPIIESTIARFIKTYPIKSQLIISHIRKANRGRVCLQNTHPFIRELWGRQWTYAHNGQLKGVKKLVQTRYNPIGTTDSEYAFCWLVNQIQAQFPKAPKNPERLWKFIYEHCCYLAEFGAFNILFSDAQHLYAFCSTKLVWVQRQAPFGTAKLKDVDFTLNFQHVNDEKTKTVIIATEPLTQNEDWQPMQRHEFKVLKEGRVAKTF